jgi:hypothetical protein
MFDSFEPGNEGYVRLPAQLASVVLHTLCGTRRVDKAFRFGESQAPGIGGDEFAAGVRFVGFEAAGAEQDAHAFAAQLLDAAAEWGTCG